MRRSKWFLIVSCMVISSTLTWACGGGGEEKPSGPTAPAATSPAGKTPTVGETPQAGGDDFSGLAEKFGKVTFKVTYQLTTGGATPAQGSLTWYKKGDNLRMDIAGGILGAQTGTVLIVRPDKSYICSEGSCFVAPYGVSGGLSAMVSQFEKTLTDPSVNVLSRSSRKIAGEDAKCYTVSAPDIEGQAEMCLSGEGVPLYAKETAVGVETTMEASDLSRDVSDSDFEPPYPISGTPAGQ